MKCCLLTSAPVAAVHFLYYAQTRRIKFSEVIVVEPTPGQSDLLHEYAGINGFNVHEVDDPNNQTCQDLLCSIKPDVVVLIISRIITRRILEIPNIATVNAHAGILPQYRGLDSRRWAILEGGPVGVTCHLVDAGVDTGPILAQRFLGIERGDTIQTLSERNYYVNKWQTLVDGLTRLKENNMQPKLQRCSAGRQYFWMHSRLARLVDELLIYRTKS